MGVDLPIVSLTSDLMTIPVTVALDTATGYYVTSSADFVSVNVAPWKAAEITAGAWGFTTSGSGAPDTQEPSVPSGLSSSSVTMSSVSLSWNASSDNVGVTGYTVYRDGSPVATTSGTSYVDNGLSASTSYSYTVSASDLAGNISAQSSAHSVTTGSAPDTQEPSVPSGLSSSSVTMSSVGLSWNASSDNIGVTGYTVYRDGSPVATTSGTSYVDSGLSASTTYSYTVSASDAADNASTQSGSISVTTQSTGSGGSDPVFGSPSPAIPCILEVLPAPGSTDVNVTELQIRFAANYSNQYSAGKFVNIYRTSDNALIQTTDMGVDLPIVSLTSDLMTIPVTVALDTATEYYVTSSDEFVSVNVAPWKAAEIIAGAWSFTTSGSGAAKLSLPKDDFKLNAEVSAWPNPFTDRLSVKIMDVKGTMITLKLYDVLGRLKLSEIFELYSDNDEIVLDQWIFNLSSGMYYLQMKSDQVDMQKFLLIKR
jgi:chitodextrinase